MQLYNLRNFISRYTSGANAVTAAAQEKLDQAAVSGGRVTLPSGSYNAPLYLRPQGKEMYVAGVEVVAPGPFSKLKKIHDGPFLVTQEAKDCEFQLPILGLGRGTGILVQADSSSSRLVFDRCHLQGLEHGISLEAKENADISAIVVRDSQFTECDTGFRVVGSNALDPTLYSCWFAFCGRAIDFSQGGSNFRTFAVGGSYCKEFIVCKAGFQGAIDVTSVEGSAIHGKPGMETFLRIGGDDAGGFGAETHVSVQANDVRSVLNFCVLNCSGVIELKSHKAAGVIMVQNKSSNPLTAKVSSGVDKLKLIAVEGNFNKV